MSDQSPPPKPKPGSLRDRIAAFEKSSSTQAPAAPPPRPKPAGGVSWKPKPPSPPSSPRSTADNERKPGNMSASDAKESIGRGGSLKERMAALQGRGGFGAPAPPLAPKPVEKPKWKPPPVVSPPVDEEIPGSHASIGTEADKPDESTPQVIPTAPPSEDAPQAEKALDDDGQKEDVDPEEEERQRRAAIAARMARLGGARVGMGPPLFGKPVPAKKPSLPPQDNAVVEEPKQTEDATTSPALAVPGSDVDSSIATEELAPKEAGSEETLHPPDAPSPPPSRSLTSMPIPAGPRRAAPPRRKAAKSPAPPLNDDVTITAPQDAAAEPASASGEVVEEPDVVKTSYAEETHPQPSPDDPEPVAAAPVAPQPASALHDEDLHPSSLSDTVSPPPIVDTKADTQRRDSHISHSETEEHPLSPSLVDQQDVAIHDDPAQKEDEEDEAARRARVSARLAKMGAVNPFAPPPLRQDSDHAIASPSGTPEEVASDLSKVTIHDEGKPPLTSEKGQAEATPPTGRPQSTILAPSVPSVVELSDSSNADDSNVINAEDDVVSSSISDVTKEFSDLTQSHTLPTTSESSTSRIPKPAESEYHDRSHADTMPVPGSLPPDLSQSNPPLGNVGEKEKIPPPPPRHSRQSLPPPRRILPQEPIEDILTTTDSAASEAVASAPPVSPPAHPRRDVPASPTVDHASPPIRLPPRPVYDDEHDIGETTQTSRRTTQEFPRYTPIRSTSIASETSIDLGSEAPKPHPMRSMSLRSPPAQVIYDEPQTPSQASQPDDEALPTVPRFYPPSHDGDDEESDLQPSPRDAYDEEEETAVIPPVPPPRSSLPPDSSTRAPTMSLDTSAPDREVLDDSEGDPIDPAFHSPISPKSSRVNLRAEESSPVVATTTAPVDDDQLRRQTIAERMAKLGGIRLGAAPPLVGRVPHATKEDVTPDPAPQEKASEEAEEEDEQARKQRILARLAGGGGMRLGMLPPSLHQHPPAASPDEEPELPVPPPRHLSHAPVLPPSDVAEPPPPPPRRVSHPVRSSLPTETDSEHDSQTFSDDGVKVEAEESELEEVSHEDAEVPPPIPVRIGRHSSVDSTNTIHVQPTRKPSLPSSGRPPVPKINLSARRTSGDSAHQIRHVPPPQSDYVMVEEPASEPEEVPPPPPPRPVSRPPAPPIRHVPLPPATEATDLSASQWELPSIPPTAIDFGNNEPDLTLSNWSEDSTAFSTATTQTQLPIPPNTTSVPLVEDRPRSSDELIAVWGRVGVQICEVATTLFEKSKRSLIGDGTFPGFINAVLSEVPNAAQPKSQLDYGVIIYMQTANAVQKRLAEIMPGDVVFLDDVKLKGHKGIQTYHQNVGAGEPLVGIVSDFEVKKSKIRVFQANQHVGQQTVESVSYRLEDVKSGVVKVFRVLEV